MAYEEKAFLKTKKGIKAPQGFHYMPSGKLMSDADHIARYGYVEKIIKSVNVDYGDIPPSGDSKTIAISGDPGIIFSVEVYEGTRIEQHSYYNFKTKTWSAASYKQTNVYAPSGTYSSNIEFPSQSALKTFTINVYAETVDNIKTKHVEHSAVLNEDNSLNLNKSSGSDSNVVTKVLYQDVIKNLYISLIAPSQYLASAGTINGATSNSNQIIIDQKATDTNIVRVGDKIVTSGIATDLQAIVTKINPNNDNENEFEISIADSVVDDAAITFTPPFAGLTPHYTDVTSGRVTLEVASGSSGSFNFSFRCGVGAGRAIFAQRAPVSDDLCVVSLIPEFGSASAPITGETPPAFFRWPVANIANLANGMALDPARTGTGLNTTTPAFISDYKTTKTLQRINESNRYYTDVDDYTEQDVFINGVDPAGNPIVSVDRNGRVTLQKGNIAFDVQQLDALKSDAGVRIIAQGAEAIRQATGAEVSISGVTVTLDDNAILTTAATSASTTIPITQTAFVVPGQTISGVGINPAVADPTVISKSTATGAGNIVVSSAQTLEDALTLSVNGSSSKATIAGTLNIKNMPISDTTLYFNVERFLGAL